MNGEHGAVCNEFFKWFLIIAAGGVPVSLVCGWFNRDF